MRDAAPASPGLFVVGHGTRSTAGVDEFWQFQDVVAAEAPDIARGAGFIELVPPDLDTGVDDMVARATAAKALPDTVVAVPLVLLGAGHMKNDGPAALTRARTRHPQIDFRYAGPLGVHPLVLEVAEERAWAGVVAAGAPDPDGGEVAIVLVGRGSSDPDANSDLYKVARLLQDSRGLGMVEPAFISLAPPSVPDVLERCRRLGARTIVTVPYFLFTGLLVERIAEQAAAWAADHPDLVVHSAEHLGPDPRIARLVIERYRQAAEGVAQVNCDCCVYRTALPGYEAKLGLPVRSHADGHGHDHHHGHGHDHGGHDHGHAVDAAHADHRAVPANGSAAASRNGEEVIPLG